MRFVDLLLPAAPTAESLRPYKITCHRQRDPENEVGEFPAAALSFRHAK
jgi:hypothetical protein